MRPQDFAAALRHRATVPLSSVLILAFLAGCSSNQGNVLKGPPAAAVALVQRGTISHLLSLAGQFEPYQTVEVHAKVSGYLRHIYVDIGDRVHAGETLGVLEVPELNAQYQATQSEALRSGYAITAAEHDVGRAQATHTALQDNFDRLQKASEQQPGLIAAQELENARSQAQASEAQVDAAQSALAGAKEGQASAAADEARVGALKSYTTITSPLTGVVTWRYADTGALIQSGTSSDVTSLPLVKIAQSDLLRLRVPVPEDAVRYVHKGDVMDIYVAALNRHFTGKVVRFTRSLDPSTRTMETEVDLPNPDLTITPGMYANTFLQLAHVQNALTLPATAVHGNGNSGTVMVLDGSNRLHTRSVTIGLRGSILVQITSGLDAGDRVVLGDTSRYRDGEKVTPVVEPEPTNDKMQEQGGEVDPFANQTQGGSE